MSAMTKTLLLAGAAALTLVAVGCDKSDDASGPAAGQIDTRVGNADGLGTSMSEFEPYLDYSVHYDEAADTTFVVANDAALAAIKSGAPVPEDQKLTTTDGDGNTIVFVETGAVTTGDLMAGFEQKNNLTLQIQ